MNGSVALSHGGHFPIFSPMFDLGSSFWMVRIMFITRNPQPIVSYGQITAPFPLNVWALSVGLVIAIAALLHLSYYLYQKPHIHHLELAKVEYHPINFYLYSLTKMTEPDPLPWFEKWTSGKVFAFWWSVFCMFMVMFYTSNLRAHLITLEYEEAPDTLDHIIKRGAVPYMYGTLRNRYCCIH